MKHFNLAIEDEMYAQMLQSKGKLTWREWLDKVSKEKNESI